MRRSTAETDTDGGDARQTWDGAAADTAAGPASGRTGSAAARKRASAAETTVSGPHDGRKFARVFMSGRSQAVRLPKEFRFDVDRVIIRREGRHIVLSPPFKDWDDYFANSTPLPDDFETTMAEMRAEEPPLAEREPFD